MVNRDLRGRNRRPMFRIGGWIPTCPPCGNYIEDCACVCAYCGERNGCRCCIGFGVPTVGD
ncbi:MAG TPA: hypothetical protein VIB49_05730 [Thermoplasmata archaeon]|jgi:hypothetical protein